MDTNWIELLKKSSTKRVKRIIAIALMSAIGLSSAISVAALSKSFVITDGEEKTVVRTLQNDTNKVLNQAGIEINEDDKVIVNNDNPEYVEIDIKRAFPVVLNIDGERKEFKANDETLGSLLERLGINLGDQYMSCVDLNTVLSKDMEIRILKLCRIMLTVDGSTNEVLAPRTNLKESMALINVVINENDIVNEPIDRIVEDGLNVVIDRVEIREEQETVAIPFETETRKVDSLNLGESKIIAEGKNGEKVLSKRVKYVNGSVADFEVLSENVVSEPVKQIKEVGTKVKRSSAISKTEVNDVNRTIKTSNGKPEKYSKVITGTCTAYSYEAGSRTSTGMPLREGIVAVDPRIIPYGKRLYIASPDGSWVYGEAVAGDTGGAAMSGRILADLFYESEAKCNNFGRRKMNIYILD